MDEFEIGYDVLEQLSNTNEDDWLSNIEGVKEELSKLKKNKWGIKKNNGATKKTWESKMHLE